jgi:hypothetical protein
VTSGDYLYINMFYRRYTDKSDNPSWGGATYYFETDSNSKPIKELAVYDNGNRRGYDLENPTDEYGSLPSTPLFNDVVGQTEWHQFRITEAEFKAAWSGESASSDKIQKAVKSIHATGGWAIAVGALNIIVSPLLELLVKPTNGQTTTELVAIASVIGLIVGGIYMGFGFRLKKAQADTLRPIYKVLLYLSAFVIVMGIISLIESGHSLGILNFILIFSIVQSLSKVQQLKKDGSV